MYKFEKQLLEESQLRAHTKVTYKTYLLRLRQFHNYIDKPLDQVYLSEIREYFLHLINVKKIGRESLRNSFYAVRFYFVYCLNFNGERRFLQHTLPKRFQRIRHYGFLSSRAKKKFGKICSYFNFTKYKKTKTKQESGKFKTHDKFLCPKCHKKMKFLWTLERRAERAPPIRILKI